jgi:glutamate synthase domain-containing protein 3
VAETKSNVTVHAMAEIFREYIVDANGLISENSYKYALSKLEGLVYTLSDVTIFTAMISGKKFTDKANYWTSGIFVSAAVNKIIKENETVKLDFASLGVPADCIGFRLKYGKILVLGNAGDYLGEHMSGGEIIIKGNAGYYVGYSMLGGSIIVRGNAGSHVGRYMSGGVIKIEGQIGSITKSYQGRIYHKGTLQ